MHVKITSHGHFFTEGYAMNIECFPCHYLSDHPNLTSYETTCGKDGKWNSFMSCKKPVCQKVQFNEETAQEIIEDNCHERKTYKCNSAGESLNFKYGSNAVSFQCLARYEQLSFSICNLAKTINEV